MKKWSAMLFTLTLLLLVACGQGKEVVDEGTDDQVDTAATSETSAATATQAAAAPVVSADAATINGTVKFEGAAPAEPVIQMGADAYCQSQHKTPVKDEEVVVGPAGELANVIVWVKDVQGNFPAPSQAALVDQKGCQYIPHVTAVQAGQPIEIRNSDSTMHNVHAMPKENASFNLGQPVAGTTATKRFDKVEPVPFKIKCDVHGWMKSYMVVLPHPFHGVSGMNGQFTIANLPPGNYTLVAWHEKYGQQEQQVTVGAKEQKAVSFTFKG